MSSREFLDMLDARYRVEVTYPELLKAMKQLGYEFQTRHYQGFDLRCYLTKAAVWGLAHHFGVDLSTPGVRLRDDRREFVTLYN